MIIWPPLILRVVAGVSNGMDGADSEPLAGFGRSMVERRVFCLHQTRKGSFSETSSHGHHFRFGAHWNRTRTNDGNDSNHVLSNSPAKSHTALHFPCTLDEGKVENGIPVICCSYLRCSAECTFANTLSGSLACSLAGSLSLYLLPFTSTHTLSLRAIFGVSSETI